MEIAILSIFLPVFQSLLNAKSELKKTAAFLKNVGVLANLRNRFLIRDLSKKQSLLMWIIN